MLYVFSCASARCVNIAGAGAARSPEGPSVVVLRCQLPRANHFYSRAAEAEEHPYMRDKKLREDTCFVCGGPGPLRCGGCKGPRYCSRAHQSVHWKHGHSAACTTAATDVLDEEKQAEKDYRMRILTGSVLPEWAIDIATEPDIEERAEAEEASLPANAAASLRKFKAKQAAARTKAAAAAANGSTASPSGGAGSNSSASSAEGSAEGASAAKAGEGQGEGEGEKDDGLSLKGLTQKELGNITGAQTMIDETANYFQRRVSSVPSQVLRYCCWPELSVQRLEEQEQEQEGDEDEDGEEEQSGAQAGSAATGEDGNVVAEDDDDDAEDSIDEDMHGGADSGDKRRRRRQRRDLALGAPLWATGKHRMQDHSISPPPCERCGAARQFEFQVMPQALQYVLHDGVAKVTAAADLVDLQFGTIAIYTCTKSCPIDASATSGRFYVKEWAWVQPEEEERVAYDLPEAGPGEGEEDEEGGAKTAAAATGSNAGTSAASSSDAAAASSSESAGSADASGDSP